MIRFSDGIKVDTSGKLRILELYDGLYVVGGGMMVPINNREEGLKIIESETCEKQKNENKSEGVKND